MNRRVEFEVWLDPNYSGPMILPTADEFTMEEEEDLFDPEFMEEAEWETIYPILEHAFGTREEDYRKDCAVAFTSMHGTFVMFHL